MKKCSKCGVEKPLSEFHKDKYKKNGYKSRCAECCRKDRVEWRNSNLVKAKQQERAQYIKHREKCLKRTNDWYKANPEKARELDKRRYYKDRKKRIAASCKWEKENKEHVNQVRRQWYKKTNKQRLAYYAKKREDVQYRLLSNLRRRLNSILNGVRKSDSFYQIIGCTNEELKAHIERQFNSGMSWENYGEWHIDHIKPCASYDLRDEIQQKKCFNFSNLQPLWASDNLSKGAKVCEY